MIVDPSWVILVMSTPVSDLAQHLLTDLRIDSRLVSPVFTKEVSYQLDLDFLPIEVSEILEEIFDQQGALRSFTLCMNVTNVTSSGCRKPMLTKSYHLRIRSAECHDALASCRHVD